MTREEAIDIIRKNIPHLGIGATEMTDALEELIPELRESKDERIRRTLVEYFGRYNPKDKWDDEFSFKDVLSYLEKQKEESHDGKKWIYEDDYHKDMERCFNDGKDEVLENPEKYGLQKEQKPAIWTEEDEKNLCELLAYGETRLGLRRWIAGLPEKIKGLQQKPAEWSEEDKRAIDRACVALRAYSNGDLPEFLPSELLGYADRLQSLRPQPSWKPSEEQMKALQKFFIEGVKALTQTDCNAINSIYLELKTLI